MGLGLSHPGQLSLARRPCGAYLGGKPEPPGAGIMEFSLTLSLQARGDPSRGCRRSRRQQAAFKAYHQPQLDLRETPPAKWPESMDTCAAAVGREILAERKVPARNGAVLPPMALKTNGAAI